MSRASVSTPHRCSAVTVWSTNLDVPTIAHCRFVLTGKWRWPCFVFFFPPHLFYFFNDKLQTDGRGDILSHININACRNVNAWLNRTVIAKSTLASQWILRLASMLTPLHYQHAVHWGCEASTVANTTFGLFRVQKYCSKYVIRNTFFSHRDYVLLRNVLLGPLRSFFESKRLVLHACPTCKYLFLGMLVVFLW